MSLQRIVNEEGKSETRARHRVRERLQFKGQGCAIAFVLFLTLILRPESGRAQGCTQCRDNTAATPQATQAAYRHAIFLMVVVAGSLFLGTVVLLKRQK